MLGDTQTGPSPSGRRNKGEGLRTGVSSPFASKGLHGAYLHLHGWVIVALVVRVPFAARRWAFPVLFRLYRTKRECQRTGARSRKKTELGRELVDLVAGWVPERSLDVAVDAAYCNATLTRGLPARVTVIGALRPDAVLTALPTAVARPRPGRRRLRGALLPTPAQVCTDPRWAWTTCPLPLYRRPSRVHSKTFAAQWYRGAGARLGRVVVVRVDEGPLTTSPPSACSTSPPTPRRFGMTVATVSSGDQR
jgi:hypothetical protein